MSTHSDRTTADRRGPVATGVTGRQASTARATSLWVEDRQRRAVERFRAESCLDATVPLGIPMWPRADFGFPLTTTYFQRKHARGEYGRYYPLHWIQK